MRSGKSWLCSVSENNQLISLSKKCQDISPQKALSVVERSQTPGPSEGRFHTVPEFGAAPFGGSWGFSSGGYQISPVDISFFLRIALLLYTAGTELDLGQIEGCHGEGCVTEV